MKMTAWTGDIKIPIVYAIQIIRYVPYEYNSHWIIHAMTMKCIYKLL